MMTVEEIMTVDPITLGADGTLEDARNLMTQHRIRHIPIVDREGGLLGLITQRDLLAATIALPNAEESSVHQYESSVAVQEVMREKVDSVEESMELRSVAIKMQQTKIGCMPVLRDSKLVGIITDSDYVGVAINLLEQLDDVDPPEFDDDGDLF
ncbi:MAG: CBS domain-containing protein [Pseudomonadales bacterium]|jgi:CBS domain-containing protein|nr:CBS domain-containing protein [Pseudomonadales bacterium]MDP7597450.1 CBS domain-containing protein [Pseudomonadales bacterium]HJN49238.1 CBS domain-containing protein [Pseudomonadales bacterium]|tara:strand:+ start:123 stop:584 length:462 start_codon:yes stop_codon:yes gene_type:complete